MTDGDMWPTSHSQCRTGCATPGCTVLEWNRAGARQPRPTREEPPMIDLSTLSDRDLFARAYDVAEGEMDLPLEDAMEDELARRFGEGATDNLAHWFTVTKASEEDMARWAREEPRRLAEIARGHDCTNADLQVNKDVLPEQGRCWCGRTWTKMADRNSWYDSTEGSDPSV